MDPAASPSMLSPADPATESVALASMKRQECGVIVAVNAQGDDIERLKSMGVCAGRRVRVIKTGSPMIIDTTHSRVGLARSLAERVVVCHDALTGHCSPDCRSASEPGAEPGPAAERDRP